MEGTVIDLEQVLRDHPEAAAKQMENQRLAIEMLDKIKGIIDDRMGVIKSGLEADGAPDGGIKYVMLNNAKVITNVLAAHMLEQMVGEAPNPNDLEHFLCMCAIQGYEDYERQMKNQKSAS